MVGPNIQVPIQCCSLQHQTLLSPPDISTDERHFHYVPATPVFLKQLVIAFCSSPVAHCMHTFQYVSCRELTFGCHNFLPFHTVHGVLLARILEWVAISSSSEPCFVRTPHYDWCILGGPARQGS